MSDQTEEEKIKAFVQALTRALAHISSESALVKPKVRKSPKSKTDKRRKKKRIAPEF